MFLPSGFLEAKVGCVIISSDVLVEELKMENNLLKRKIQVLQELLEFKMEKIRTENGNIKK